VVIEILELAAVLVVMAAILIGERVGMSEK